MIVCPPITAVVLKQHEELFVSVCFLGVMEPIEGWINWEILGFKEVLTGP